MTTFPNAEYDDKKADAGFTQGFEPQTEHLEKKHPEDSPPPYTPAPSVDASDRKAIPPSSLDQGSSFSHAASSSQAAPSGAPNFAVPAIPRCNNLTVFRKDSSIRDRFVLDPSLQAPAVYHAVGTSSSANIPRTNLTVESVHGSVNAQIWLLSSALPQPAFSGASNASAFIPPDDFRAQADCKAESQPYPPFSPDPDVKAHSSEYTDVKAQYGDVTDAKAPSNDFADAKAHHGDFTDVKVPSDDFRTCGGVSRSNTGPNDETGRATIVASSKHGSVTVTLHRSSSVPYAHITAASQHGSVSVYIPRSFRGPISTRTQHGRVVLSPELVPRTALLQDLGKETYGFIGDMTGWGGSRESWTGDELVLQSKHSSIRVFYEAEPSPPSSGGLFSKVMKAFS